MAVPVIQSSATTTATGASINATKPSGVSAGDLLVCAVFCVFDQTQATPSGWTLAISEFNDGNGANGVEVYYRVADGSEGSTITFSIGGSSDITAHMWRITGFNASTPVNISGTNSATSGSTTAITSPSVTTTADNCLIIRGGGTRESTGISDPGSHSALTNASTGTGATNSVSRACYTSQSSAGSTGTAAFVGTGGAREWVAWTLAINESPPSIEQEGFRWREDSGNEATPTWADAQDADTTWPLSSNLILRAILNTADDPGANAYQLRYKKSTESAYTPVPTSTLSIARSAITAGADTGNTATYTTASVTLTAGRLYVMGVVTSDAASEQALSSIATTGGAISFASLDSQVYDTVASNVHRLSVWWVIPTTTVTATIVITPNDAATGCAWNLQEFTNPDVTGATPFGTPAKSGVDANTAVSATPGALTNSSSVQIAFGAHDLNSTSDTASGTNWSSVGTGNAFNTPATGLECAENTSGTASQVTFSGAGSADRAAIAVEIKCMPTRILMSASSNIAGGGEATTAQLTAPNGKSGSDFTTGRRWDDENGTDTIDLGANDYTELEWCLIAQSPAANADIYQFRVYKTATAALDTYSVTPQWTIGTHGGGGGGSPSPPFIFRW